MTGQRFSEAAKALQEVGLDAEQDSGFFSGRDSRVEYQDPEPGTQVPPGTTITLHTGFF